ncbi:MAG TPA: hypothetical protein DCE78_11630 [Bacteroidetes bacterium]|nr:hypothetical protein [Bacteroidota bacterium]
MTEYFVTTKESNMNKPIFDPTKTVLTITVGFLVIYFFSGWEWSMWLSMIIGISGLLSAKIARLINFIWTKITQLLSLIIPNIILALIFYLILFPIATLQKLFGEKDSLKLKPDYTTTWVLSNSHFDKANFEKPW